MQTIGQPFEDHLKIWLFFSRARWLLWHLSSFTPAPDDFSRDPWGTPEAYDASSDGSEDNDDYDGSEETEAL